MYVGYALIGLLVGLFVAGWGDHYGVGAFAGVIFGLVLARLVKLERRVRQLESSSQKARPSAASAWGQKGATVHPTAEEPETISPWLDTEKDTVPLRGPGPSGEAVFQQSRIDESAAASHDDRGAVDTPRIVEPSLLQVIGKRVAEWFTSGNVPVKVGVIISFIGVSFLLKYAVDRRLVVISLELRLIAVAIAGIAMLLTGWRLRSKKRVYALSLQGGGIGILFLTIFAALRLWQLLPASLSFVLLVVLTICTGALAVVQNSRSLAILGIVGGFLAPVLTSTGEGNHVALFSYYLVLNGAILGIAWFRAWRGLNLVGWVFTFVIGSLWGYQYYRPELLVSTQPFLVLYFLFYQVIAILFALRQPPQRLGYVDVALVFGTPVVGFALQAALVEGFEYALAWSAIIVAIFYALTAIGLWRSKGEPLRLLIESYTALAVVFATIAIPLAFDARWTTAAWAVEGAALVWVGVRQGRHLAKLAGILLLGLSGIAFLDGGWQHDRGLTILNGNVLGGVLISIGALFASRKLEAKDDSFFAPAIKFASIGLFIWGALWWFGTAWAEINDRIPFSDQAGHHYRNHASLLFLTLSMATAAFLGSKRQWHKMRLGSLAFPLLLIPSALNYLDHFDHFLVNLGWLAWPLTMLTLVYVLRVLDEYKESLAGPWHIGSLLLVTVLAAFEAYWWMEHFVSRAWGLALAVSVPGMVALMVWRFNKRPAWPIPFHPETYHAAGVLLVVSQVVLLTGLVISDPGNPVPLPYIPLLNPFDLATLFSIMTVTRFPGPWQKSSETGVGRSTDDLLKLGRILLAAVFFILTTCALVRGVHHYTNVPWRGEALFDSVIVQTALSIYWGLLGFIGMIWGARSSRRTFWLTGVGFMALVVIKLFLVDLGNTGTVERIISFIGIGGLLLVVGYFAPAPPRANKPSRTI